jgi:hypothetical protein
MSRHLRVALITLAFVSTACHDDETHLAPDAVPVSADAAPASADAMFAKLVPSEGGLTLYDPAHAVYWLADADFARSATGQAIQAAMGVVGVNPDGTMNYATAVAWIAALNQYPQPGCAPGQLGYLCHSDWQLPVSPMTDTTCTVLAGTDGNSFGPDCQDSAFGSLFYDALGFTYPSSVSSLGRAIGPFQRLQPSLYWTSTSKGNAGQQTFSFLIGDKFANTTTYNLLRILPMAPGAIGGTPPPGTAAVRSYTSGPGAGLAFYDSVTDETWTTDANLAASNPFGVSGSVDIAATPNTNAITLPDLAADGSITFGAIPMWLAGMNQGAGYAGMSGWELPSTTDIVNLFTDLALTPDDGSLVIQDSVGPFGDLQPFFYWSCPHDASAPARCDYTTQAGFNNLGIAMQFAFNFDTGFQGTDENTKVFYVLPYHP